MKTTVQQLKNDFNDITLLKMFEIEVINKETQEQDFIIFDIQLIKNTLFAQHAPLTKKEEKSKKIAFKKIVLDDCFSLDEHLQELYSICIESILISDFYTLAD